MSHLPKPEPASGDLYLRTELLERIAHELRGPAGVTLGALDEIERSLSEQDGDGSRALLSMARRGARRILRTAERLTRTAQLEAGSAQMTTMPLDLREIVARAARDAEQIEGRSAVRLEISLCEEPCVADVDVSWLGAALNELISQAIRCARQRVQLKVTSEGDLVHIEVQDDRTSSAEVSGTRFLPQRDRRDCALGWPLAQDVARAHGGDLTITPITGEGCASAVGARAVLSLRAR